MRPGAGSYEAWRCGTAARIGIVGESSGGHVTVEPPVMCRVDKCKRRAAASVAREHVPGPIQLCAIHTEGFPHERRRERWTATGGAPIPARIGFDPRLQRGQLPAMAGRGAVEWL
jgi:hypothetical protein